MRRSASSAPGPSDLIETQSPEPGDDQSPGCRKSSSLPALDARSQWQMTSQAIRDPLADHLITPQNSAFVFIDYQPEQFATVRSMETDLLLENAVSTVKTVKT